LSILQTAANPYVAIVGPIESAAKRISIMGICNKIAGAISPLVLGAIVLKNADSIKAQLTKTINISDKNILLNEMASKVIAPYIVMTIVLVVLGLLVLMSSLPEIEKEKDNDEETDENSKSRLPQLIFGVVALFLYVGAEVISGDTIILYGQYCGIPFIQAKVFTTYTMIAMIIGYIVGISLMPKILSQEKALGIAAILGLGFTTSAIFSQGYYSVFSIAALGFANAVMWPAIWPLAINGLGKLTKIASALLIMGIAGGATLPLLYGRLSDMPNVGNQNAYMILIPCYLFIFFYAVKGHKLRFKL
jgi:MFS transporter, FHS family, L-fucose permease